MTRYDRYGDPIEDEDEQPIQHDARCHDGWLGEDHAGHPIPCLQCRQHLLKRNTC